MGAREEVVRWLAVREWWGVGILWGGRGLMGFSGMVGLLMEGREGEDSTGVRSEPLPLNGGGKVHHFGF